MNACSETLRIFDSALGGAQHCQCGNYTLVHAATFDWLLGKIPEGSHVNQGLAFSAARTASRAMSGSMDYFLRSPRLGFRCWREDDLPLAIELWGDAEVTALIGGPFTPEQVGLRLAKEIAQIRDFHMQYWPVFLLDGDRFVGCAGLRPYRAEQRVYELGVHLCRRFWGQGLAKEAALAVIDYGFDTLGVDALFAGHHPANLVSRGLLLKLGFVHTHEELYEPTGLMHPSYLLRRHSSLSGHHSGQ